MPEQAMVEDEVTPGTEIIVAVVMRDDSIFPGQFNRLAVVDKFG